MTNWIFVHTKHKNTLHTNIEINIHCNYSGIDYHMKDAGDAALEFGQKKLPFEGNFTSRACLWCFKMQSR